MLQTVYSDADFLAVIKQRKKVLGVFWGVTLAYAALCIGMLVYYIGLPYNAAEQALPKWMVWIASAIYVIFLFPFMGIKYHRVNRYYKLLYTISEGIKNEEKCYFAFFAEKDLQKENVDVISCVFKTWNAKKQEWMEREVYFDVEKDWPDLEQGDLVRYVVQSNFLVRYDVLVRQALTAEELGEDDSYYEDDEEVEGVAANGDENAAEATVAGDESGVQAVAAGDENGVQTVAAGDENGSADEAAND